MLPPFVGDRKSLDEFDIPMLAHRLDTGEDELRAFLEVEARSRGYDRQGRPIMLFEPHVFYRNLHDREERDEAVAQGLAYAKWGMAKYPKDSYPRLEKAIEINQSAALKACSIGLSQVLVENHSSVGYATPQAMWKAFMNDEQEHVEAMVRFILVNGIADDLKAHRWSTVARVYNGPGYKKNRYHTKMAAAYRKFAGVKDVDWAPAEGEEGPGGATQDELRQIQAKLRELGYVEAGKADGAWGTKTRAAVLAFRADNDLPLVANVDQAFKAALAVGQPRAIGDSRAKTQVADLRTQSRTIKSADASQGAAVITAGGGGLVALTETLKGGDGAGMAEAVDGLVGTATDQIGAVQGLLNSVAPLMDTVKDLGPWIILGLGGFIVWQQISVKRARVDDHRTGKNAGPVS